MSTPSPPSSPLPSRSPSPSQLYPPSRSLPLPEGTTTLLPLVEACDNLTLPKGPWGAVDCKRRWEAHEPRTRGGVQLGDGVEGSALDDDDEDEEEGKEDPLVEPEDEFLVPFFLSLPHDPAATSHYSSRRPSASSHRPSFNRLTPLPAHRSSSPPEVECPADSKASKPATAPAQPIGFLRPAVVRALVEDQRKMIAMNCAPPWSFLPPISFPPPPPSRRPSRSYSRRSSTSVSVVSGAGTPSSSTMKPNDVGGGGGEAASSLKTALEDLRLSSGGGGGGGEGVQWSESCWRGVWAVGFAEEVDEEGREARREQVDRVVRGWKMAGEFSEVLGGWRDEEYDIYGPALPASGEASAPDGRNVAFSMERSACALFGVATFGVHMTAYIEEEGQPLKFWIPRRAATKQTWPSYLDNTVAGGISAGSTPYSTILRESIEEASLPPSFVASRIRSTSVLVYNYRTEQGWIQPEVQYVFDLPMDPLGDGEGGEGVVKPGVNDGEVEEFVLMELDEVVRRMCDGEFKPNCALVLIDLFLRHGYLTPESDTKFLEVAMRLRRTLELPGPA